MPVARPLSALCVCLMIAGCGGFRDSRLNPVNWFGRSEPRETIVLPDATSDPRPLIETVLSLSVEPMPGGAIIRARGQTPTQGWWQAELVPLDLEDGSALVYEFRLLPPLKPTAVNTAQSRQVDAAIFVSDIRLDGVREIVVQGAGNARTARR